MTWTARLVTAAASYVVLALSAFPAHAQWSNRYPMVEGYSHHVYLEGYELPTVGTGVLDAAPSPDGRQVAFSSRGWLWLLDRETGEARRLTRGGSMDSRPAWDPEGERLAFVRDSGEDTTILILDLATNEESEVVSTGTIDLDPAFSPDGRHLYYVSARAGDLDIWRLNLEDGADERVTTETGLALHPDPHPDGRRLLYLSKSGAGDQVRTRDLETGEERVLRQGRIASQARPVLSPNGRTVAVNWPHEDGWELLLLDLEEPSPEIRLTRGRGHPVMPVWSADGSQVLFSEADAHQRFQLFSVGRVGGEPREIRVGAWEWGEETGTLRIRSGREGGTGTAPARLGVRDHRGHPVLPDRGQARFDGESGEVFFYSPGLIELRVPAGETRVQATRGFSSPMADTAITVEAGAVTELALTFQELWNPAEDGWYSGDHHFHLNYGGPYLLEPEDLVLQMEGEDLDVATPLVANLHNRMVDRRWAGWERADPPLIHFGLEVRSGFLGHVGLAGVRELFWPWVWGPGNEVYGHLDLPNAEALRHARRHGGVAAYVHPVFARDPFQEEGTGGIPRAFVPDAVLGELDAIEVACLWTSDLGSSEVWYRVLNLGIPLAAWAGTDVMTNFYRTMAVGTTRVYVRPDGPLNLPAYLEALREGRSFVTTGPLLDLAVEAGDGSEVRPGEAVAGGATSTRWSLELHTPVPVGRIEVVVNGRVVHEELGLTEPGSRSYSGEVELPEGGWLAVRAHGGEPVWPSMSDEPFAHTSPVWIGEVGSFEPEVRSQAARELLQVLTAAEEDLHEAYEGVAIPRLEGQFQEARERLEGWVAGGGGEDGAPEP